MGIFGDEDVKQILKMIEPEVFTEEEEEEEGRMRRKGEEEEEDERRRKRTRRKRHGRRKMRKKRRRRPWGKRGLGGGAAPDEIARKSVITGELVLPVFPAPPSSGLGLVGLESGLWKPKAVGAEEGHKAGECCWL